MRKLMLSLLAGAALWGVPLQAASSACINSPEIDGYIARGRMMLADNNYEGCIDQMLNAVHLGATGEQLEEASRCAVLAALALDEDGALAALRSWLDAYPASPLRQQEMARVGDAELAAGDYKAALEAYAKVDPKALTAPLADGLTFRKAYALMQLGRLEEAKPLLASLVESPRWRSTALFYQGYLAYADKDYARALDLFKSVDTSAAPGNAAPYYMAQIHFLQGSFEPALREARKAMASGAAPALTADSRRIAGESLYALGRRDEAVKLLWEYAAETDVPEPSAFYILGVSEWDRGDYPAAAKLMQQATRADNAMGQSAWLYLGQIYLRQGDKDSAVMAFEQAYRAPYDAETSETAFYNYAVAKSSGGSAPFGGTAALLEDFLEKYPSSRHRPEVEAHLVNGYMSDGDYEGALRTIEKAANPSEPKMLDARQRALFSLGTKALAAGDAAAALARMRESRAAKGSDASLARQALLWEGDCQAALGNEALAAKAYEEFLAQSDDTEPNRALAWYDLGYARYAQRLYAKADEAFARAVALGSLDPRMTADARSRMGDCQAMLGSYAKARADFDEAASLTPGAADYPLFQSAMMQGYSGDNAGKIASLDRMMQRFPASPYIPEALLEKGVAQASQADRAGAAATFTALLKNYPNTAQGRRAALLIALDRRDAGKTDAAMKAYREVISRYPASEEARLAADDLKAMMAAADRLDEYVAFMNSVDGAPKVEQRDIDTAAFRAAESRYLENDDAQALMNYLGHYPGGAYEAEALYYLAENAEDKGLTDQAVSFTSRIVEEHPSASVAEDAMVILARALTSQGKEQEAVKVFTTLEKNASNPSNLLNARLGLMRHDLRAGNNDALIARADKVLAGSDLATDAMLEALFMRGLALSRSGKMADAEADWSAAASHVADVNGCKSAVYLAQSLLERGDAKGAARTANTFIDAAPAQPYWLARAFIVLSDALRAQGNSFEADQYLTSLRNNYPGEQPDIFLMIDERLSK